MEASIWMLPRESIWGNMTLVSMPARKYSAQDYEELFTDIGYTSGFQMLKGILPNFPAPNVPTYCFYGVGRRTVETMTYANNFVSVILLAFLQTPLEMAMVLLIYKARRFA